MEEKILLRIADEAGVSNLVEVLANIPPADLHSIVLSALKGRVQKIQPGKLTEANAVTQPLNLDARLLHRVEQIQFDSASAFEVIELSPVVPLGAVGVLTGLDQANVLSTIRAFECASDPTVGMALECARRRKDPLSRRGRSSRQQARVHGLDAEEQDRSTGKHESQLHTVGPTRLCTSQRVIRFPVPQKSAFTAHFKLFCLVTAGRDTGSYSFETETLHEHIDVYLRLLSCLSDSDLGFSFRDISVELSDTTVVSHLCSTVGIDRDEIRSSVRARDHDSAKGILEKYAVKWPRTIHGDVNDCSAQLAEFHVPPHMMTRLGLLKEQVGDRLQSKHDSVAMSFNLHRLTGLGYYDGPCFHIKLKNDAGESFMLADGGFVNWTRRMLGDSKERLMTSAIGTELLCRMFRLSCTEA